MRPILLGAPPTRAAGARRRRSGDNPGLWVTGGEGRHVAEDEVARAEAPERLFLLLAHDGEPGQNLVGGVAVEAVLAVLRAAEGRALTTREILDALRLDEEPVRGTRTVSDTLKALAQQAALGVERVSDREWRVSVG